MNNDSTSKLFYKGVFAILLTLAFWVPHQKVDAFYEGGFDVGVSEWQYQGLIKEKVGADQLHLTTSNAITITKQVVNNNVNPGTDVTFDITVTNDELITQTNVVVTDGETPTCDNVFGQIAPGAFQNYTCVESNVMADFINSASVTSDQNPIAATDDAAVNVLAPAVEVEITTNDTADGSDVQFTVRIENTGEANLSNISVSNAGSDAPSNCDNKTVDPINAGNSDSFTCRTDSAQSDGFVNIVTVTADGGGQTVMDSDSINVYSSNALTMCSASTFNTVAHWSLDSLPVTDLLGGHDGACTGLGCPVEDGAEMIDGSLVFDGIDDTVTIDVPIGEDTFDFSENDDFSVSAWVKGDDADCSSREIIFSRKQSGTGTLRWWLGCEDASVVGAAEFHLQSPGENSDISANVSIMDGEWHHVVGVRDADGSNGTGDIRLYVDGTEVASTTNKQFTTGFAMDGADLNIGTLDGNEPFGGNIDETSVFAKALTSAEIQQFYLEGRHANHSVCNNDPFAPVIYSTPVTSGAVQSSYSYQVLAVGDPTPTYQPVSVPSGMTIDTNSGQIDWTPKISQSGDHNISVQATNSQADVSHDFTVTITKEDLICGDNIIAYWPFDETTPGLYADVAPTPGGGHDAVCNTGNCPIPEANGHVNGAQILTSTRVMTVPTTEVADFAWEKDDSFSIELWMKTPSNESCDGVNRVAIGRGRVTGSSPAHNHQWWVGIKCDGSTGTAAFQLIDDDTGESNTLIDGGIVDDGNWHHVAAVRNGSTNVSTLYVDGTEVASTTIVYSDGFYPDDNNFLSAINLGWLDGFGTKFEFDGTVDEIAIYGSVLSADAILDHYNRGNDDGLGFCYNPQLSISKTPDIQTVIAPNATVPFSITVTNDGDVDLTNVTLNDPAASCTPSTPLATLEHSGGSQVYTCESTGVNASFTNVATITGDLPSFFGAPLEATAEADVVVISPAIMLTKTAVSTIAVAGSPVTFTLQVQNTGDSNLENVSISDDQCVIVDQPDDTDLAPSETSAYTCIVSNPVNDINNTAMVTATATGVNLISTNTEVSDTDSASVDVINPSLSVGQSPLTAYTLLGETVTLDVTITNNSPDTDLQNVVIDPGSCTSFTAGDNGGDTTLSFGETWTYTCTLVSVQADMTNTLVVTANTLTVPDINHQLVKTSIATVDVITPAMIVTKDAIVSAIEIGDTAEFTITVTNSGDSLLSNVQVQDTLCSDLPDPGDIDAGESWGHRCFITNATTTLTNTVMVTATPQAGPELIGSDSATVEVFNPGLSVTKLPDIQYVEDSGTATFTITISNTGDITITSISAVDAVAPNCDQSGLTLAPMSYTTYVCSVNVTGDLTNTITVNGTPDVGQSITDAYTAVVDVINPELAIIKTPSVQTVPVSTSANFMIAMTNTGDVTLENITWSDPATPSCDAAIASLAPGASHQSTCTTDALSESFTNVVTATGTHSASGFSASATASAEVVVINPGVVIQKTPDLQRIRQNMTATFSISVTNTGNGALSTIVVTDANAPDCDRSFASLGIGETESYTCTMPNVAADITNTANVTAQSDLGSRSHSDSAIVDVIHPSILVDQVPLIVSVGTDIAVTIVVSNTGDVDLTYVSHTADACTTSLASSPSNDAGNDGILSVGEAWHYACVIGEVTEEFVNNASAVFLDPIGLSVESNRA
ncbi:MAG: LamG-like jellyroll fold domain-containing protein, partial [Chloroflexota bacterium]